MVDRRRLLSLSALAAAAGSFGLGACSSPAASSEATTLQLAWWGNDIRNRNTAAAIEAYQQATPGVTLAPQPGEWASYWDRLATQTVGGDTPDVIQMSTSYLSEYGARGVLLDLGGNGLDTTDFSPGTLDAGTIDNTLYGVNAGINTPTLFANPALFEQAGVALHDDSTWTWEELLELGGELTAKLGDGAYGLSSLAGSTLFEAWVRQAGKELFTPDGLAFDVEDAVSWLELMQQFAQRKAFPGAGEVSEDAGKALGEGAFVTGRVAMAYFWSNQLEAATTASGAPIQMWRYPSLSGRATDRKAWYHASMMWSASARSEHPEAAVAFIDWMVNSTEAAGIERAERGIPANGELRDALVPELTEAQQTVATFITDIEPELSAEPIALPPGGGVLHDVLQRYALDMQFGRTTPAAAAQGFVDEVAAEIAR